MVLIVRSWLANFAWAGTAEIGIEMMAVDIILGLALLIMAGLVGPLGWLNKHRAKNQDGFLVLRGLKSLMTWLVVQINRKV